MRPKLLIAALLVALTLAVFGQVARFEFLTYDDADYVTANPHVQGGLTPAAIVWALTTMNASNWHPLTWISHTIDWQLYGPKAAGHHVTSLLLHLASVLLLFHVLVRMTGAVARSGVVAALFAIHPLHVESVAWIAERKDVLSTLFLMLAILAYARYVERGRGFAWVAAAMAAGLMAKPMLVTLPLLLLLLDVWPLRRPISRASIVEKLPLFALSAASSVVTYVAQAHGGAVRTFEQLPLSLRASNALVSYVRYVLKMLWPSHLAIFYPHPRESLPIWMVGLALLALAGATYAAWRFRRSRPELLTGWLWYVITLIPVIGLVQIGDQALADRYTYVPLVGLFLVVAWSVPRQAAAVVGIGALAVVAYVQTGYWKDTMTLFSHALSVTRGNFVAHQVVGDVLASRGALDEAVGHYREALAARPSDRIVHNNLAGVLYLRNELDEAEAHAREAIRLDPKFARARNQLGLVLAARGRLDDAVAEYRAALAAEPDNVASHYNLGMVLLKQGRLDETIEHFRRVVALAPGQAGAYGYLARALLAKGDVEGARREVEAARARGFAPPADVLRALSLAPGTR